MTVNMDEYLSHSLKNWAARHPAPKHLRTRVLERASNAFAYVGQPVEELLRPRPFGRPILDGAFGSLIINNMYLFSTSMTSMRMVI